MGEGLWKVDTFSSKSEIYHILLCRCANVSRQLTLACINVIRFYRHDFMKNVWFRNNHLLVMVVKQFLWVPLHNIFWEPPLEWFTMEFWKLLFKKDKYIKMMYSAQMTSSGVIYNVGQLKLKSKICINFIIRNRFSIGRSRFDWFDLKLIWRLFNRDNIIEWK